MMKKKTNKKRKKNSSRMLPNPLNGLCSDDYEKQQQCHRIIFVARAVRCFLNKGPIIGQSAEHRKNLLVKS
jgi:hypothetical protein